jgi:hypothetical protein
MSRLGFAKLFALCAFCVALLGACSSHGGPGADAKGRNLHLKLKTAMADHRYTYFEINRGELSYGGGRAAAQMQGIPVLRLTPQQTAAIWAIIDRHDLMHAHGSLMGKGRDATYDLSLDDGQTSHSIHATDDKVLGIKELQQLLFDYQAEVRYKIPALESRDKP